MERWKKAKDLSLSHTNCWGTWWWCTGVGKTFGACIIINKILEHNSGATIVIMVPGPDLKKQWLGEIKANVNEKYASNIRIFTVEGILSIINEGQRLSCSLFIADELHEYYTEERLKIFNGNNIVTKWMLGLTATYKDNKNRYESIESILPVVDRIDEEEGLKEGFISQYIEYNMAIELTVDEAEKYRVLSDMVSKNMSKFGHRGLTFVNQILKGGIEAASIYASEHGWRRGMSASDPTSAGILELWAPNKIIGYAKAAMDNIRERKTLLYHARNKLVAARDIAVKFEDLKTIFFGQSTLFADALGKVINDHYRNDSQHSTIPCVVYHSQLQTLISYDDKGNQKKKGMTILKRDAIEAIRSGKARRISTASSLDKGFDVKDIRLAVTTSGTQNPTQYSQRKGRGLRVESYEEEIIVLVINMYARGTIDEQWLRKRQSTSNNIVYWVTSIDDINYSPRNSKEQSNNFTV